jgi:Met-10+ like-protein
MVVGDSVSVLYVLKKNAKTVKTALEDHGWILKEFRMTPAVEDAFPSNNNDDDAQVAYTYKDCLAIPIVPDYLHQQSLSDCIWNRLIIGLGTQHCPFSTGVLGNPHKHCNLQSHQMQKGKPATHWSPSKQALLLALQSYFTRDDADTEEWKEHISSLDKAMCPSKLEFLGDDQNLVLPHTALLTADLDSFLRDKLKSPLADNNLKCFQHQYLWPQLARAFASPRILRKGGVDPESRIRHSGYQLLWPSISGADTIGPGSPGWITVTEQGIRQSFDVTQVMFSRGNISEKIRFGTKLVQKGDVLLDLYAGIGYYTLPALVQGRASHVYACEWNPCALECLMFNLRDNCLEKRVTVLQGDCRAMVLPKTDNHAPVFDRVSLGLLPSSEGGWKTAIQAIMGTLPTEDGRDFKISPLGNRRGWLHVHGNVPAKERDVWAQWLVRSLHSLVLQEWERLAVHQRCYDWVVICHHIEKVKSFAPTVNHYVADVFVGPREQALECRHPQHKEGSDSGLEEIAGDESCFVYDGTNNLFSACTTEVTVPSCALSPDGVLHQEWMRSNNKN